MNLMTQWLEHWSVAQPEKRLFTFLDIDGRERESYTYRSPCYPVGSSRRR